MLPYYGYSYTCPCGTIMNTENGLDHDDQLEFMVKMVNKHRQEHKDRMLDIEIGSVL